MAMRNAHLALISNATSSRTSARRRLLVVTVVALLAVVLVVMPQLFNAGTVALPGGARAEVQSTPAEMTPTDYFPAQYQNQAQHSPPEDHIQAF